MILDAKKTSKIQTNEPNTNGYGDFQPQQQTTNYQTSSINFDDTYNPSNQNCKKLVMIIIKKNDYLFLKSKTK